MSFLHDLRRAIHALLHAPRFTLPALLTLAFGLGGLLVVSATLRTLLFAKLPYREPDRIVRVWREQKGAPTSNQPASWPIFEDLLRDLEGTEALAGARHASMALQNDGDPELIHACAVTPQFFRVFEARPALGGLLWDPQAERGAVLSHGLWTRRFGGDPGILGRSLVLDGESHPIVGVLPPQVDLMGADAFIPFHPSQSQRLSRGDFFLPLYARLAPGVDEATFQASLAKLQRGLAQSHSGPLDQDYTYRFRSMQKGQRQELSDLSTVMTLASAVLLILALLNLGGQFLVRALAREGETALRRALGAGWLQSLRPLLLEALLIASVGSLAGGALAMLALPLAARLLPASLLAVQPAALDPALGLAALVLALAVATGLAMLPMALRRSIPLAATLQTMGRGQAGSRSRRLRPLLVAGQAALALALLAAFGLLSRSLLHLHGTPLGLRAEGLATFALIPGRNADPARSEQELRRVLDRLNATPGIAAAGSLSHLPVEDWGSNYTPRIRGRELPLSLWIEMRKASPRTFAALGTPLLSGREFNEEDMSPVSATVLVSRSAAGILWPGLEPLGQEVTAPDGATWLTVVGVVEDVRYAGPASASAQQALYFPGRTGYEWESGKSSILVRFREGHAVDLPLLRRIAREEVPRMPLKDLRTMREVLSEDLARQRTLTQLLGFAALLALAMALAGVHTTLSQAVLQRRRELGVRLALGASPRQLLLSILGEGLLLAGSGIAAGLLLAWAGTHALEAFLFGVKPMDPASLLLSALGLLLAFAAASLQPALQAFRMDPAQALRSE